LYFKLLNAITVLYRAFATLKYNWQASTLMLLSQFRYSGDIGEEIRAISKLIIIN